MKPHIHLFPLLLIICMLLSGCGQKAASGAKAVSTQNNRIQIGMTFASFVIERWQRDRDVFVSMANKLGADVNVQSANGDIEEQKKQIEYFIQKGVDVIVIVCIDSDSLSSSVAKAKEAGIKVIAYDRLIRNADVDMYISFDNARVGELMAEAIINSGVENGKVIMLGGDNADDNVPQLESAFLKKMEEHNNEVIGSMHAQGWKAEKATEYMYSNMDLVEQADAIMCGNDMIASAAIQVLSINRKAGEICVVGQDAELEACQHIVEGLQEMTVYKPVGKLANLAAECAVALAKGEELDSVEILTMNDGSYDVPYVKLDPIPVNASNINEIIIGGGFHLKEDVYLNEHSQMPE